MKKFLKNLLAEILQNGKSLVVWVVHEFGLTEYPGLVEALNAFLEDPSNKEKLGYLVLQVVWAAASSHRLLKILKAVIGRA